MTLADDPLGTPPIPDSIAPVKSPLALTGVFLEILRKRFDPSYDLPWKWYPGDAGRKTSTIHIEAGGNRHTEEYGRRPAVYVIRNPISFGQAVIGDRHESTPKTSAQSFYALAQTGFTFSVEAEESGEAEFIADIVLSTIMMGSDQIERTFMFRKLGPFAMSAEIKTRQDSEIYLVNVQMGLSYDVKWATLLIRPLLKEILVKLKTSNYTNNDDYFATIYQESLAITKGTTP